MVRGIFRERLHRFGAMVRVRGRMEYCHVTNSGRLRELLHPGARVALVDHGTGDRSGAHPGRKTRYAVRLALYRRRWVCIEANMAPRLVMEAWKEKRIPFLRKFDRLRAEVPVDHHTRFDFQAADSRTGEKAWIEVKCVTLVEKDGVARFPDAPSERASKHLRELMSLSRRPRTRCYVLFILQNPWGRAVGPKEDTDPLFAETLRKAAKSKVYLAAFRARVGWRDARLAGPLPVLL